MYAKQYEIALPTDYDMRIIRNRVAAGGRLLDDRAGLGVKAYLIRSGPVNEYAPFYLWADTSAMAHFLLGGGGFQNIVRDFGRPTVRHWTVAATFAGPARSAQPTAATRRIELLPAATDIDDEIEKARDLAREEGVHTVALGVDPQSWQLLTFALWADGAPTGDPGAERYEVLHLSAPGLSRLPEGRHW